MLSSRIWSRRWLLPPLLVLLLLSKRSLVSWYEVDASPSFLYPEDVGLSLSLRLRAGRDRREPRTSKGLVDQLIFGAHRCSIETRGHFFALLLGNGADKHRFSVTPHAKSSLHGAPS